MAQRTAIALGSNLGDRLAHLQAARDRLRHIAVEDEDFQQAAIYQTAPVACPDDSPDFLNTVVEICFDGSASELLELTQQIEADLGRVRDGTPNAPRTIDVDILYFGDQAVSQPSLELPHPRLADRRFVLEPLAEIAPGLHLPGFDQSIASLLEDLPAEDPPLELHLAEW